MNVFFDLDGTLTDPKIGITRCLQYALHALGEPAPETSELLWCIGPPLRQTFVALVGEDRADQAVALYRERFAETGWRENEPYAGIDTTLEALAQHDCRLYVATSKPAVFARQIVEHFELARHFDEVFGSELSGALAEKGELLQHALASTPQADRGVMIGDRSFDVIGAQRNGLTSVGVTWGYGGAEELRSAGADHTVHSPDELLDCLVRLRH